MLDGILNLIIENSLIPTTFSFFPDPGFEHSIHTSVEQLSSLLSDPEISSLVERIVVSTV
jgi:hypothetical protein